MFDFEKHCMGKYSNALIPYGYYHMFNRAVGSEKLFLEEENYSFFIKRFNHYVSPIADIFCYCLLPNHFHFLIRVKPFNNIAAFAKQEWNIELALNDEDVHVFVMQQFSNAFNSYTK